MGIMGAIGAGLAEAGGTAAEIGLAKVKSAIEEDRTARLAELQSEIRVREAKTTSADRWQETVDRAPAARDIKAADTTATEQARKDVDLDPTNVQAESYKAGVMAEGKAEAEVAAMIKKSTPEALAAARKIAAATRDPAQQRLLGIQIAEAQLRLDEGKTQAGERKQVRGLMSAAGDVDTSQPGAAEAKEFYKKEAKEAEKGAQLAKGVDVDKADRSTYLALAKEKYDLANKEMDPARKDKLIEEGDAYAAAAQDKQGTKVGAMQDVRVGGKVIGQAATQADAAKLVAAYKQKVTPKTTNAEDQTPAQIDYPETPGEKWVREKRIKDEARVKAKMDEEKKKAATK